MNVITGREPKSLFSFFEAISAIPRMSYREEAIADYLVAFARERNLSCYRDESHNVFITMPASKGYEDRAPILLQAHSDMVCEKNGDVEHDFLTEPLKLYTEGDWLRAKGTTLGADDGIGVAIMLAVLDGAMKEHPAVECLFTSAEEVGLDGAKQFDYSRIRARKMVNLDSESLGVITAGCAGGLRSEVSLSTKPIPFEGTALRVSIKGLAGGHSGENIHEGRANANKLMGRLLSRVASACGARIVSIEGGSKDNAIPRECEAIIAVKDRDLADEVLSSEAERIAHELVALDRSFTFTVEDVQDEPFMLSEADTNRVLAILCTVANGVFEMNHDVAGLVEYSRNLGVICMERDTVRMIFSSRSAMESRIDASAEELDALARALGAKTKHYARYPGWNFATHSPLREAYCNAYRAVTGKEAIIKVIHAGLECGIIFSKIPDMDIISIAPNLKNLHSPDEALDLASVEVFWKTLEQMLRL